MVKKFSLQPLVHLSQQQHDAATRKFGQLNQQQQATQAKLDALLQFRKDYQTRFQEAEQNGMNQAELRNFQGFILRLDEAIEQQRNANEQARSQLQVGRNELQEAQRKMKSFDTLAQRHIENEKKLEAKSEQRQQDEHTGRLAAIKALAAQNED
jgi:flagellar FliJ protein